MNRTIKIGFVCAVVGATMMSFGIGSYISIPKKVHKVNLGVEGLEGVVVTDTIGFQDLFTSRNGRDFERAKHIRIVYPTQFRYENYFRTREGHEFEYPIIK